MSFSDLLNMPDAPQDFMSIDNLSPLPRNVINSSPTTLFDNSLLSPASISFGARTTPGSSTGSEGRESPAYIRLWRLYQQREQEFMKTKQDYEELRYVSFVPIIGWHLTSFSG